MSPDEKLAYMANQIAKFFAAQGEPRASTAIADHIQKYWDPEMRRTILALGKENVLELHPSVKIALPLLKPQLANS